MRVALPEAKRLTLKQQAELAVLPWQLWRYIREMRDEGFDFTGWREDLTPACCGVCGKAATVAPGAWAPGAVDWDAIIDFLERLLPIILKIIEIFGGL